jgi:chorismate mutase
LAESAPVSGTPDQRLYALRGAATAERNDPDAILAATRQLMRELMERNELRPEQIVSCIFTTTEDLNAEFPAVAARDLGLDRVPLLCSKEIDVPGAMKRVIRVLVHCYGKNAAEPQHVYLGEARTLRADLHAAQ